MIKLQLIDEQVINNRQIVREISKNKKKIYYKCIFLFFFHFFLCSMYIFYKYDTCIVAHISTLNGNQGGALDATAFNLLAKY